MPIPPRTTLLTEMRMEQAQANAVKDVLERSANQAAKDIRALGKDGNPLTRMQLDAQRAALSNMLIQDFGNIEKAIAKGKVEAARAASQVVTRYENELLAAVMDPAALRRLSKAEADRTINNLEAALRRMEGTSYVPLSKQVYNTTKLARGWVDQKINQAIVSGWDARRLAQEIASSIDPKVRGGVSYAANRLARTEINNAYHAASWDRYVRSGIVGMVQWNLSTSHPEGDVCDGMASSSPYEKAKVPSKPHPNCYCYITPVLPDEDEFLDNLLAGKYGDEPWMNEMSEEESLDRLYGKWQNGVKWRRENVSLKGTPEYLAHEREFLKDRERFLAAQAAADGGKTSVKKTIAAAKPKSVSLPKSVEKPAILNERDVADWATKNLADPTQLSAPIRSSLSEYAGHAYSDINSGLRSGRVSAATQRHIDNIDEAMRPLANPVVTRRTTTMESFDGDIEDLVGRTVTDKGYMSTSLTDFLDNQMDQEMLEMLAEDGIDITRASTQVLIEIRVPAGAKGVWMEPLSGMAGENELLLNRNSALKIVSATREEDGRWKMIADLIL